MLDLLDLYWHEVTAWLGLIDLVLVIMTLAWILTIKKEPTSAIAWCLVVLLVPLLGVVPFLLFGYQHVSRPMKRIVRHRVKFRETHLPSDRHPPPDSVEEQHQRRPQRRRPQQRHSRSRRLARSSPPGSATPVLAASKPPCANWRGRASVWQPSPRCWPRRSSAP